MLSQRDDRWRHEHLDNRLVCDIMRTGRASKARQRTCPHSHVLAVHAEEPLPVVTISPVFLLFSYREKLISSRHLGTVIGRHPPTGRTSCSSANNLHSRLECCGSDTGGTCWPVHIYHCLQIECLAAYTDIYWQSRFQYPVSSM